MLDKRLVLRILMLLIQAIDYHISSTPINRDDPHAAWHQQQALNTVRKVQLTFSILSRAAGYKLEDLERD